MTDHTAKAENSPSVRLTATCHPTDTALPVLATLTCLTLPTERKTARHPRAGPAHLPAEAKAYRKGGSTGDISLRRRDPRGSPTTRQHCHLINAAQVGKPGGTSPQHCPSQIGQLTQARSKVSIILHILRSKLRLCRNRSYVEG